MEKLKGINRELDPHQMFHDNSEMIGTDIDDLQEFAGRNVITEREFGKMFQLCECGHHAPPEFIYTDEEGVGTCANCIVDFLKDEKDDAVEALKKISESHPDGNPINLISIARAALSKAEGNNQK